MQAGLMEREVAAAVDIFRRPVFSVSGERNDDAAAGIIFLYDDVETNTISK
jgi:hypothetical protein